MKRNYIDIKELLSLICLQTGKNQHLYLIVGQWMLTLWLISKASLYGFRQKPMKPRHLVCYPSGLPYFLYIFMWI